MFTYSRANTPLGQSERAYYLSYFIKVNQQCMRIKKEKKKKNIKAACLERAQQLPTLLGQQCWESLRACLAVVCKRTGCNNSQQVWDLQCLKGRIQPISLCNPCVMSVRGPNNVGRALQTDTTLLCYASEITEHKKCSELLAEKFDRFQTLRNNTQQHPATCNRVCKLTLHVTSNNVGCCRPTCCVRLHPA